MPACLLPLVVASFAVPSPVWSCSWCPRNPHQLYGGTQDGRLLLLDTRVLGARGGSQAAATPVVEEWRCHSQPKPLHTTVAMGGAGAWAWQHEAAEGRRGDAQASGDNAVEAALHSTGAGMQLQCLVAGFSQGVWGLAVAGAAGADQVGAASSHSALLLRPLSTRSDTAFTCENCAVDLASATMAVSWRPSPGPAAASAPQAAVAAATPSQAWQQVGRQGVSAYHSVLQGVAAGWGAGVDELPCLFQPLHTLTGHSRRTSATCGIFIAPPGCVAGGSGSMGWFASADEDSCRPVVWCLGSGREVARLEAHVGCLTKLCAGAAPGGSGMLLACCSSGELQVYRLRADGTPSQM